MGSRIVRIFAREDDELEKFSRRSYRVFEASVAAARVRAVYIPLIAFIPNLAVAFLLYYGGRQVIDGQMTLGALVAFYSYLMMFVYPAQVIGWLTGLAQRAIASGNRVYETAGRAAGDGGAAGRRRPAVRGRRGVPLRRRDLRARHLRVRRPAGAGRRDASTCPAGRTVALVGHTGCGKTTLTNLIPRFYDPDEGRVLVDGLDVRDLKLASLRADIGIVNQDPFLFSASIADNIRLGRPEATLDAGARGGQGRAGRRVHRGAARRLRHRHRRARPHAQRRPAAAHRHRAGAGDGPAHPHPRRRHVQRGRGDRAQDPPRPAGGHVRAHHLHHRPPAQHHLARRRDRGAGQGTHRRARHPRGADGRRARCTRACSGAPRPSTSTSTAWTWTSRPPRAEAPPDGRRTPVTRAARTAPAPASRS